VQPRGPGGRYKEPIHRDRTRQGYPPLEIGSFELNVGL
jgi:hypothetical protein